MSDFQNATVQVGVPGLNGGGITSGDLTAAIAGLAPATATYIVQTANGTLTGEQALDALGGPGIAKINADGSISLASGTDIPDHDHTGVPISLSFVLDGGGVAITTGAKYTRGILVPAGCTVTEWVVDADAPITVTMQRAPNTAPGTFADISGSDKPKVTTGTTNSSTALTGWSTALAFKDRVRPSVDSGTATEATITLLLTRTV